METCKFTYKVGILVNFTDDELTLLRDCCLGHYDHRVKAAGAEGGFVYGWLNARCEMGEAAVRCSFDELDTCAKALEIGSEQLVEDDGKSLTEPYKARLDLRAAIKTALRSLNSEWSSIECRTIVAALNAHLSDSPVLIIDEASGLTEVAAIDDDIIAAIDAGIMDAVRFHEGNFQQYDADLAKWVHPSLSLSLFRRPR